LGVRGMAFCKERAALTPNPPPRGGEPEKGGLCKADALR
jgi:hypothetical protein